MENTKNKIKEIVDGLTYQMKGLTEGDNVIGKPFVTVDGCTVLPVSKVSFGFAAGGGDYGKKGFLSGDGQNRFAGLSGGGATITPVAFLVVTQQRVQLVSAESGEKTEVDKFAELAKDIFVNLNR